MSDRLDRRQFELLLDEYLRGDLDPEKRLLFQQYLATNPAARRETEQLQNLLGDAAGPRPHNLDDKFVHQVQVRTAAKLAAPPPRRRTWRPVVSWGLVAAALAAAALTLWPTGPSLVMAQVMARLQEVSSLQVEGWVRAEDGARLPFRQWVLADGTLRAEVGPPEARRTVVLRNDRRLVRDRDGTLYHDETPARWPENLDTVLRRLQATYQSSDAEESSFTFTREELNDVVRFTRRSKAILGQRPSRFQWILDVDKVSALPVVSRIHQMVGEQWVQVSELQFRNLGQDPQPDLFELPGPVQELDEEARQRLWFELTISPGSIQWPAVWVPKGGMEVVWLGPGDVPEGMNSGGSQLYSGGVTTFEIQNMGLDNLIRGVARLPVAADSLASQRVSLILSAKTVLPWRQKLAPVLDHLGLDCEVVGAETIRKRYVFSQNGSSLTGSQSRFASSDVNADSNGYQYSFQRTPLRQVVSSLLGNCRRSRAEGDTVVFLWTGAAANPFDTEVDFDFTNQGGAWTSNKSALADTFGVTLEVIEEKVTQSRIRLMKKD